MTKIYIQMSLFLLNPNVSWTKAVRSTKMYLIHQEPCLGLVDGMAPHIIVMAMMVSQLSHLITVVCLGRHVADANEKRMDNYCLYPSYAWYYKGKDQKGKKIIPNGRFTNSLVRYLLSVLF
jgi:hypothetical protein